MTAAETAPDADGSDPRAEIDHLDALISRQSAILTGVANALRGDPGPLASHSHHDLAERAASTVAALAVASRSLEAATSGERITTCDELARLTREVASLRAAYAADLAGLRAEVRRADDERAAWRDLRDAAREMLAALEAPVWDADESEHDEHAARLTRALAEAPTVKISSFTLLTPNGTYEAGSIAKLLWLVVSHRLRHLVRGEGWID